VRETVVTIIVIIASVLWFSSRNALLATHLTTEEKTVDFFADAQHNSFFAKSAAAHFLADTPTPVKLWFVEEQIVSPLR